MLCSLIVYFCFHAAVLELRATRQYKIVSGWPRTDALIHSATAYWTRSSWSGKRYCPLITYSYNVDGHYYSSRNSVFDFTCWPDAYDFAAKLQSGTSIQIAYDLIDPTTTVVPASIRDPGYPWGDTVGGFLFLALMAADLSVSWRREDQPEPSL